MDTAQHISPLHTVTVTKDAIRKCQNADLGGFCNSADLYGGFATACNPLHWDKVRCNLFLSD
jgi:hypothetical protein